MESSIPSNNNIIKFKDEPIHADDKQLHILQTGHILNAETLRSLDGIVITVSAPDEGNNVDNQNISSELTGKIWQVVPADGNSDVTHIIAVDQTEASRGELSQDECEFGNELDSNSILSSDTLTSMLLSNPLNTRSLPPDTPSWALKLRDCEAIGDSYRGWIASEPELDLILTFHKQQTQSFWGTRQSPASQRQSTRLMWKSQYVPYDGIPFINSGSRAIVMECQYGPRRRGQAKRQNDGVSKSSFKQTCPARIYIKRVCKFPDYVVDVTNTDRKHLRSAMDKAFQELKQRGFDGHGEERWYVQLPTIAAHEFHEVGKGANKNISPAKIISSNDVDTNSAIGSRMHPKIIETIREFVQKGENRVYVIRKQLRKFVEQTLFESLEQLPERHNLSYFPTVHSIQNQIYQAMKDLDNGKIEKLSEHNLIHSENSENEDCENSGEDSTEISTFNQPLAQQEMITVTLLTPHEIGDNSMISQIETQLGDGTFQVSTTITPELLHRIKNFHCATILNESEGPLISLPETAMISNIEEKTTDDLGQMEQLEDEESSGTFTVTMMEDGKVLQVANNSE